MQPGGEPAWARASAGPTGLTVQAGGRWTLDHADALQRRLAEIDAPGGQRVDVDMAGVEALDTAGAWVLFRFLRRLEERGTDVALVGSSPVHAALIERMVPVLDERQGLARSAVWPVRAMVERVGATTLEALSLAYALVGFFGVVALALARTALRPGRLRVISLFSHVERIGLDAIPIVGLLSFLIGVVLAYQGADQLRAYGAEIFTVNLLGVSVLRELGGLLTAVMVAGRSGSAFTAEIGTMKVNEEVDALKTLGLDPIDVLVVPRLVAMIVALPLLTVFANGMALVGGAVMATVVLDISRDQFLSQLHGAISTTMFWIGVAKAPFFGALIAMVGCYEGLRVEGSAESVGLRTTSAVVQSIFLVIVADAAFSILFSYLRI